MVVYCEYIYRKYPQIFNSEAIKLMIKNHHEKKAEEREKKKEESLVNKKNKLREILNETNLFDRFYYIQGENEFSEPFGTINNIKELLKKYIYLETISNSNHIKIKIFIGKTIR